MGTEDLRQLMDYRYIAENGKFSTNFASTHYQNFSVLSESDIKRLQDTDINHILSVLSTSRSTACLLLTSYNWNVTQALESWFDNKHDVQKSIGLSQNIKLGFPNSNTEIYTCDICFETFASDKIKSSWCGHPFCINCWNQYVDTNIDDHNCFKLKCPQPSCNAAVDEDMIHQLASKSAQIKYDQFLFRSYVENNSNMKLKWCPAPNCCYAVSYYEQDHGSSRNNFNYDVTCRCYHSFCWNCGEEAHAPVNCETVAKWMKRSSSEFKIATIGWIIANTKRCPNCKIPIEKDQGCNHMICKCGFHFCWLCLRDWSLCPSTCGNSFNGAQFQIFEDEMQGNHAEVDSDRYTYYYQGWVNNEIPRKEALQNLIEMSTRLTTLHNQSETYFNYIKDALKQIVECRRILKWSFVYGYYLPHDENAKIEFFDHIENIAQFVLERLLRCAQNELTKFLNDGSEEEFPNYRLSLVTLTRVSKSYFMNLVNELENGLDVVVVKNYTGVKRESSEMDEISFRRWNTRRRSTIDNMIMRRM